MSASISTTSFSVPTSTTSPDMRQGMGWPSLARRVSSMFGAWVAWATNARIRSRSAGLMIPRSRVVRPMSSSRA